MHGLKTSLVDLPAPACFGTGKQAGNAVPI